MSALSMVALLMVALLMVALLMVAMSITEVPTITKTSAITMVSIAKKRAAIGLSLEQWTAIFFFFFFFFFL
jgi:hypothetical protein